MVCTPQQSLLERTLLPAVIFVVDVARPFGGLMDDADNAAGFDFRPVGDGVPMRQINHHVVHDVTYSEYLRALSSRRFCTSSTLARARLRYCSRSLSISASQSTPSALANSSASSSTTRSPRMSILRHLLAAFVVVPDPLG